MWYIPAPTLKSAVPKLIFPRMFVCVMTTPPQNLLKTRDKLPFSRGYCPRLNSSMITRLGLPSDLHSRFCPSTRGSDRQSVYCKVWPCFCRDKSSYSPGALPVSFNNSKAGLNGFRRFHHYPVGAHSFPRLWYYRDIQIRRFNLSENIHHLIFKWYLSL